MPAISKPGSVMRQEKAVPPPSFITRFMPERTRAIFILYRVENMSQDAIAAAFGISASAVKQHVARAMAQLVRKMRDVR